MFIGLIIKEFMELLIIWVLFNLKITQLKKCLKKGCHSTFQFNVYDINHKKISTVTKVNATGYKLVIWLYKSNPALYGAKGTVYLDREGNELLTKMVSTGKIRITDEDGMKTWGQEITEKEKVEKAFYWNDDH